MLASCLDWLFLPDFFPTSCYSAEPMGGAGFLVYVLNYFTLTPKSILNVFLLILALGVEPNVSSTESWHEWSESFSRVQTSVPRSLIHFSLYDKHSVVYTVVSSKLRLQTLIFVILCHHRCSVAQMFIFVCNVTHCTVGLIAKRSDILRSIVWVFEGTIWRIKSKRNRIWTLI